MRRLLALVLLAAPLLAQGAGAGTELGEGPGKGPGKEPNKGKPEYDELGFPITFNDERITRNDALRALGPAVEVAGPGTLGSLRDQLLMDKLTEKMGQIWGIEVAPGEVKAEIRREVLERGGEAKFYEYLTQRGETLAGHEEKKRLQILRFNIEYLLTHGVTPPPLRKVLPWSVRPTPDEVRIAFEHDKSRRKEQGARARGIELTLQVDRKTRFELHQKHGFGALEEEIRKYVAKLAEAVVAELKAGKPFLDVARQRGVDTETQGKAWRQLPSGESRDPVERFFQSAKPGAWSEPIPGAGGIVTIAYLIERETPGQRGIGDPAVLAEYNERVRSLRRDKVEAIMRLQALDRSIVRPRFVLDQFRKTLLEDLRVAVEGLRELGLN